MPPASQTVNFSFLIFFAGVIVACLTIVKSSSLKILFFHTGQFSSSLFVIFIAWSISVYLLWRCGSPWFECHHQLQVWRQKHYHDVMPIVVHNVCCVHFQGHISHQQLLYFVIVQRRFDPCRSFKYVYTHVFLGYLTGGKGDLCIHLRTMFC